MRYSLSYRLGEREGFSRHATEQDARAAAQQHLEEGAVAVLIRDHETGETRDGADARQLVSASGE